MAKLIPRVPDDYHGSSGEREVVLALRHLPDDYYVFHSLRWLARQYRGTQGEADIAIFHPAKGFFIIEIKSGGIRCQERVWYQTNLSTKETRQILDPAEQAERSRFFLMEKVKERLPRGEQCRSGHAVWFTSLRRQDLVLPTNYVPEIVLDWADLNRAREAVEGFISFWCKKEAYSKKHQLSERGVQRILGVLAPVTDAAPSLRASVDERDREMVRLTTEQARILDFLDEQKVAAICGNAGTGKTFIAWEKARRLALRGQRVLFVCFNSALRELWSAKNGND